jgi:hypothetical protein
MRIERAGNDARERSVNEARLSVALAESFNAALRRSRSGSASGAEESRKRAVDRAASRASAEERARRTGAAESEAAYGAPSEAVSELDSSAPMPGLLLSAGAGNLSLLALTQGADSGATVLPGARGGAEEMRRSRRSGTADLAQLGSANGRRCIDVVDPRTGLHFVLSEDSSGWLLSLRSQTPAGHKDLDSLLATLRTRFAEAGLGPIDLVLA